MWLWMRFCPQCDPHAGHRLTDLDPVLQGSIFRCTGFSLNQIKIAFHIQDFQCDTEASDWVCPVGPGRFCYSRKLASYTPATVDPGSQRSGPYPTSHSSDQHSVSPARLLQMPAPCNLAARPPASSTALRAQDPGSSSS